MEYKTDYKEEYDIRQITTENQEEKTNFPKEFFSIESIIETIVNLAQSESSEKKLYLNNEYNEELSSNLLSLCEILNTLGNYSQDVFNLIRKIEKNPLFAKESFLDNILIIFEMGKSQIVCRSLLALIEKITSTLPFEYWLYLFSGDNDYCIKRLIEMIEQPSMILKEMIINGRTLDFSHEDKLIIQDLVINIHQRFLTKSFELGQKGDDLYLLCKECTQEIIRHTCNAFDMREFLSKTEILIHFLDFILNFNLNFIKNSPRIYVDEWDEINMNSASNILIRFALKHPESLFKLCLENLAKLIPFIRYYSQFNDEFFNTIFGWFMESEEFRVKNQKSICNCLFSLVFTHNINIISKIMSAITNFQPILMTFSQNPNEDGKGSFCSLCYALVMSCFIDIDRYDPDYKKQLNENGIRIIYFLYQNKVFYALCDMALNDDIFKVKIKAAEALAHISSVMPYEILSDLILNHEFAEIFHRLVDSEESVFKFVVLALRSMLILIGNTTNNSAAIDLFIKLDNTNILNEIKESGNNHENEKLNKVVDNVVQLGKVQMDRLGQFIPK